VTEVLTADEVAELLRVDRKTVYDYAGRGTIPHRRLGKRLLFSRSAIMTWLSACEAASGR
jgi:excisionase family DNA binding protein